MRLVIRHGLDILVQRIEGVARYCAIQLSPIDVMHLDCTKKNPFRMHEGKEFGQEIDQ